MQNQVVIDHFIYHAAWAALFGFVAAVVFAVSLSLLVWGIRIHVKKLPQDGPVVLALSFITFLIGAWAAMPVVDNGLRAARAVYAPGLIDETEISEETSTDGPGSAVAPEPS